MSESLHSRLSRVKFSSSIPGADPIHHVTEEHVRVVLSRLPFEFWARLRAVHFNDRACGARVLGYVTAGHREVALCALPPRMSLSTVLVRGQSPQQFGARRGQKWPALAIRRFILYDVLVKLVYLRCRAEKFHLVVMFWKRSYAANCKALLLV
jgi:hypothetical protein